MTEGKILVRSNQTSALVFKHSVIQLISGDQVVSASRVHYILLSQMRLCVLKGKTVTLKIKTVTFEVHTRAQTMAQFTNDSQQISLVASRLLRTEIDNSAPRPLELRLMG